jgi:hypothetical protein
VFTPAIEWLEVFMADVMFIGVGGLAFLGFAALARFLKRI